MSRRETPIILTPTWRHLPWAYNPRAYQSITPPRGWSDGCLPSRIPSLNLNIYIRDRQLFLTYGIAPVYADHLRMRSSSTTNCKRCFTEINCCCCCCLFYVIFFNLRANIYFIVNKTLIIRYAVFNFRKTVVDTSVVQVVST